ncbi:MAG: flavodoxin [Bacteroidales bacterium]|nr:flavodoxin [Bacteroidales bacterium]MBR4677415.1 flavodoxin [Bacteroidales bacterium]
MKKTVIIYGSTTGNAASAAQTIAEKLGSGAVVKEAGSASKSDLTDFDNIILGSSTWGDGELQDDWYTFLPTIKEAGLSGKTVAVFGVGDQFSYSDTFVNAMGELYEAAKSAGAKIIGATSTDGYSFNESSAVKDGKFVGLALDYDNQSDLSDDRIAAWVAQISPEL